MQVNSNIILLGDLEKLAVPNYIFLVVECWVWNSAEAQFTVLFVTLPQNEQRRRNCSLHLALNHAILCMPDSSPLYVTAYGISSQWEQFCILCLNQS
jgi:hypothetical protein